MLDWLFFKQELDRHQAIGKSSQESQKLLLHAYVTKNRKFADGQQVRVDNGLKTPSWNEGVVKKALTDRVGPKGVILYEVWTDGFWSQPIGGGIHAEAKIQPR